MLQELVVVFLVWLLLVYRILVQVLQEVVHDVLLLHQETSLSQGIAWRA